MLLLQDTTATRPDEFQEICQQLVSECTPDELKLLEFHWSLSGLSGLLDHYLERLPSENLVKGLRKEYRIREIQVKCLWGLLLDSVQIREITPGENYRIHDVPKGRRCRTIPQIRAQAEYELCTQLPKKLELGDMHQISYISNTGVEYSFCLFSAKCENFEVEDGPGKWMNPAEIKIHPEIAKVIRDSIYDF